MSRDNSLPAAARTLPRLGDGTVLLRAFEAADAAALAEIWRDETIRARNTVPEPNERAARAWVARTNTRPVDGLGVEWAIVDAATNELAGRVALWELVWADRRASAAIWVGSRFRGRRLAPRALRLAAAHAYGLGFERIHAECETDNDASLKALLAAGFRHEATLRLYFRSNAGKQVDAHVLGMLVADLSTAPDF
jgi:RimJ/RimL family protein N-acetyltransferase